MSVGQASCAVTHGYVDDATPETLQLQLPVVWTNFGAEESELGIRGISVISTPNVREWDAFKRDLFSSSAYTINDLVAYLDSEDDLIPIECQCELDEALRIATRRAREPDADDLHLVVDRGFNSSANENMEHVRIPRVSLAKLSTNANQGGNKSQESSEDTAPKWFTDYMKTMKEEIVAEISEKVTKTVKEALRKNRKNETELMYINPRFLFNSQYILDSDSDDSTEKNSVHDKSDEGQANDSSARTFTHHFDNNPRRRNRNPEKQRKKYKKNISQAPNNFENPLGHNGDSTSHDPSPMSRHRGEKFIEKSDNENARGAMTQSVTGNLELAEEDDESQNPDDSETCEFDTPYRKMVQSGIRQMTLGPVNSVDIPEPPIFKFRLVDSNNDDEPDSAEEPVNEVIRLGCSVTGKDIFEPTNDRVPKHSAPPDSDNISIISDNSRNSDVEKISNGFEMIDRGSPTKLEETDHRKYSVTSEYKENNQELPDINRDDDENFDSSSFELLSDSGSPSVSIHMQEDHFSPNENETKTCNSNADTNEEKRDNQYRMISRTLVIDVEGRIYSIDMINTDDVFNESIFQKRTDGNYSFVFDNLSGSAKEKSNISTEETIDVDGDFADDGNTATHCPNETNPGDKSPGGNSRKAFHESTQSFNSHTAPKVENECHNFEGYTATNDPNKTPPKTSQSHIFVDRNASKGLGDTKKSRPRKEEFQPKDHDEFSFERPKEPRKQPNNDFLMREDRNLHPEDEARIFRDWSTTQGTIIDDIVFNSVDPMHILPETIVTNAVHVATRAYTTARRVYDKIVTNQTRTRGENSKFGRRYAFSDV